MPIFLIITPFPTCLFCINFTFFCLVQVLNLVQLNLILVKNSISFMYWGLLPSQDQRKNWRVYALSESSRPRPCWSWSHTVLGPRGALFILGLQMLWMSSERLSQQSPDWQEMPHRFSLQCLWFLCIQTCFRHISTTG